MLSIFNKSSRYLKVELKASIMSASLPAQEKKQKIDFQDGSQGLSVKERKRNIYFKASSHSGHPGFPIGTILANFDIQITLMLSTKIQVN